MAQRRSLEPILEEYLDSEAENDTPAVMPDIQEERSKSKSQLHREKLGSTQPLIS